MVSDNDGFDMGDSKDLLPDLATVNCFFGASGRTLHKSGSTENMGMRNKAPIKTKIKKADNSTKTFHQFGDLPTELRRLIWDAALPEDEPTIYTYGKRYGDPHRDPDWSVRKKRGEKPPVFLVQAATPVLMWVSREARAAVTEWMKRRGYTPGFRKETGGHIITRPFEPDRDVLYVPAEAWEDEFSQEAFDMTDDDADAGINDMYKNLKHLALPAYTAVGCVLLLVQLFEFMPNLESLSVLWDELPTMRYKQSALVAPPANRRRKRLESAVQPRWELELLDIEGAGEVRMIIEGQDREFSNRKWEHGNLAEMMETMRREMVEIMTFEPAIPKETLLLFLDDNDQLLLELRPMQAVLKT